MVINSPWMLSKNWLVQKQMAFDKDISNPFMADNLPKIVWFSTYHVTFMKSWLVQNDSLLLGVNTPRSGEDRLKLMELMVFLLQKGVCVDIEIPAARLSSYCCQANKSDAAEGFKQIIDFLGGSYIHYALTVSPHIYISCIKQFWNTASVKRSGDVTRLQALVDKKKIMISEAVIRKILQLNDAKGVVCLPNEEIFVGLAQMGYEKPSAKLTFYKAFFSIADQVPVDAAVAAAVEAHVTEDVSHDAIPSPPPHRVKNLETANAAQKLEIVQLKGRMIDMDMNKGIELVKDAEVAKSEGRNATEHAEKQAEIYNLDLDHSSKVMSMQEDDSEVQEVVEVVTTAKLITEVVIVAGLKVSAASTTIPAASKGILVETSKPMKKKDQIEIDAEYARKLQEEIDRDHDGFNKDIDWDATMDHVNQKSNNPQYIKRYQGMKKRPQTETRFDENIRFLFKLREEIEAEDQEIIKSINETLAQKAAKRRKLKATLLASKIPVVDYQIVLIDNKPRFKIIRPDETHQFYISFATLLKNFDREDLETLWRIVKDRFSTSKPTNFSDEYLLLTLRTLFEEPDGQDAIWRNQKSVHGGIGEKMEAA
nr:hypothetical protein [Tanacetum cinerariifolium]